MTINFMLLLSPVLALHNPETVVVTRERLGTDLYGLVFHINVTPEELSARPSLPEILWNFSRYKDRAHLTLEHNPHFYLRCPTDEAAYTPTFQRCPLQDPDGSFEHNDTVYVLFDRPGRVFLETGHKSKIFGNIWLLNGSLIFRGFHFRYAISSLAL